MEVKRILMDTDIGCDCDDAGAMAVLHTLADKGLAEIIAVTHSTTTPYGAACIDVINRYYGRPDIPIGVLKGTPFLEGPEYDVYAEKTARHFHGRYLNEPAPDALRIMRQALQSSPDRSVTLLFTGPLRSFARLLQSEPDDISPLDGIELVRQKVTETVAMGGCFFTPPGEDPAIFHLGAEYNLKCAPESVQYVAEYCSSPLVYCGFELGCRVITGKTLLDCGTADNPVRYCYAIHRDVAHTRGGRESWDLLTALYAVLGSGDYFGKSPSGRIHVDAKGVTHLEEIPGGRDVYLTEKMSPDRMQLLLDDLLLTPPQRKNAFPTQAETPAD